MDTTSRSQVAVFGLAFVALGILIGHLLALSAQSLVQAVVAALFALFGGSVVAMLEKLSEAHQAKAALAILAVSVGALVGVYAGLYVNEHQLMTPEKGRVLPTAEKEPRKYLRENTLSNARAVDQQYRNGALTAKDAYDKLQALMQAD